MAMRASTTTRWKSPSGRVDMSGIGGKGLWSHITDDGPKSGAKETEEGEEEKTLTKAEAKKWVQEDLMVLSVLRVFELKRAINSMKQDGGELTKHMGNYKDVIKHILRSPNLPSMEEVCAQLQNEEGSLGMFGGKGELTMAHQAEGMQANKDAYRGSEKKYEKYEGSCEHCKRTGNKKSECWILHPHLRPRGFNRDREAKAHLSAEANGAASSGASSGAKVGESEGRVLASHQLIGKGMDQEVFKRADLEAFFKALKESGNTLGNTLGYSYAAHTLPSTTDKLLDIFKNFYTAASNPSNTDSDNNLIKDIEPAHEHVMIANGDKIPIRGIGKLKLFNKDSKAFLMPEFTSNLLSVKRFTTDLQCNVIFSPDDVKFQDIKSSHTFKVAQHGILHQTSCPYTPQQNGVAEGKNIHLMEVARSMMFHKSVPKRFWSDAVMNACYLINRIPTRILEINMIPTRILEDQSPFEVLNKSRPVLDHLRTFGCVCYVLVPGKMRNKLEAKSTNAMLIGYSASQKGYKCFDPTARRVLVSRDVKFIEDKGYYEEKSWEELEELSQPSDKAGGSESEAEGLKDQGSEEAGGLEDQGSDSPVQSGDESVREVQNEGQEAGEEIQIQEEVVEEQVEVPLRRSTRIRRDASEWANTRNWVNTRVYYNAQAVEHSS
ncbi:PREDICTED: uncharacterized protein LOC106308637 [Brassica oleracea var. oleracea]|uniref:uncharacterized protein LOC106308637 n=1 Tax=Brassica oleracea var. oleracea TaxID=109376 RepID=UPI0006A75004|nr:PREDICTED: uncharacterized protein LOC106308637 [Brassica oleracea var. oleracea]